jgi:ribosome-binding protein aMBF1 (putative translation factor)
MTMDASTGRAARARCAAGIQARRMALGLSASDLAWMANVTAATIRNLEAGRNVPYDATLHALDMALAAAELEAARHAAG